jgi:hypothetical protein
MLDRYRHKKCHVCSSEGVMRPLSKVLDSGGERGRNRTYNLVIKSHLLCQLSYAPA